MDKKYVVVVRKTPDGYSGVIPNLPDIKEFYGFSIDHVALVAKDKVWACLALAQLEGWYNPDFCPSSVRDVCNELIARSYSSEEGATENPELGIKNMADVVALIGVLPS